MPSQYYIRRVRVPRDTSTTTTTGSRRDHEHLYDRSTREIPPIVPEEQFSSLHSISFDEYITPNTMSIVGCHSEGESWDVVVGGIPHLPGDTMQYKQIEFMRNHEWRRGILLNEPRGRCGLNAVFLLPPCHRQASRALLFAKNEDYVPISISGLMAAAKVVVNSPGSEFTQLSTPITKLSFDTPAGLIDIDVRFKRESHRGSISTEDIPRCESITVHGVPSFVLELDFELDLYEIGVFTVDIAYGGVICAFVDASTVGLSMNDGQGQKMIDIGERIKKALDELYDGYHPSEPTISRVSTVVFTDSISRETNNPINIMAAVVSPGRLDRSPSGTAVCARLAVLHARGEISSGTLTSHSLIGTKFYGRIRRLTSVNNYPAILPSVMGRAWIHTLKQVGIDPEDPFPEGSRNADHWGSDDYKRRMTRLSSNDLKLPKEWR